MKKILIVEDDASQLSALQTKLASPNVSLFAAHTVQQAITLHHDQSPDIVILDIMLPGGLNGFDFIEQIENDEHFKDTHIIVATNLNTEAAVAKTMGITDYFIKAETTMEKLEATVQRYLGEASN